MTAIVQARGYAITSHVVITADGFELGLFNIPPTRRNSSAPAPVVFLQHGLEDSSWSWVCNFPTESLGFILADRGLYVPRCRPWFLVFALRFTPGSLVARGAFLAHPWLT